MKKLSFGVLVGALAVAVSACNSSGPETTPAPQAEVKTPSKVERGKYLVTITGCNPLEPGPWWMLTNMTAFAGPWGISYAANITPDTLTGIGIWTEDIFTKALRN